MPCSLALRSLNLVLPPKKRGNRGFSPCRNLTTLNPRPGGSGAQDGGIKFEGLSSVQIDRQRCNEAVNIILQNQADILARTRLSTLHPVIEERGSLGITTFHFIKAYPGCTFEQDVAYIGTWHLHRCAACLLTTQRTRQACRASPPLYSPERICFSGTGQGGSANVPFEENSRSVDQLEGAREYSTIPQMNRIGVF